MAVIFGYTPPAGPPSIFRGSDLEADTNFVPPYIAAVTGLTTLTVTAATHGMGIWALAFCFDNAVPANHVDIAWTRAANGDITIYWGSPFTGTVQIN